MFCCTQASVLTYVNQIRKSVHQFDECCTNYGKVLWKISKHFLNRSFQYHAQSISKELSKKSSLKIVTIIFLLCDSHDLMDPTGYSASVLLLRRNSVVELRGYTSVENCFPMVHANLLFCTLTRRVINISFNGSAQSTLELNTCKDEVQRLIMVFSLKNANFTIQSTNVKCDD
jgi:hypothetical protein